LNRDPRFWGSVPADEVQPGIRPRRKIEGIAGLQSIQENPVI